MMLVHIGQADVAARIHNAWLKTIEDGVHTSDIFKAGVSRQAVGTNEFAEAVVARLGQSPETLKKAVYAETGEMISTAYNPMTDETSIRKETVGVDVFLEWRNGSPDDLGALLQRANGDDLRLQMITNRGVKVFPGGMPETFCTDHWRCRFMGTEKGAAVATSQIVNLLNRIDRMNLEFIKLETLCTFDGELGYSLGQGQ
jgi:isocitrate dehydrogenase